jgi:eukaryotic-like serine/threonine-protein kinase
MVSAVMPLDPDDHIALPRVEGLANSDPFRERVSSVHTLAAKAHAAGDVLVEKYRLISLLGEGGMGAVWRAHSLALDIDVAVKVVRRDAATRDASERLLREARAAASIGHPAIVRVFDFGVTDAEEPYLVMELLEGESLADWLDRSQRIAAGVAVQLLLPVMSALAAAHAQGIVHRDIKPENILIANGEGEAKHPKLLDFGIVKFADPRGGRVLTEVGMLMGSPEYMSPEQAQGLSDIDGQTDVWSLAVVLYELITGRRPFHGSHSGAVLISIFRDEPAPTTQFAAGDDNLWAIIQRGLAKEPLARWEGMREFGQALAAWALGHGIEVDATGVSIARHWQGSHTSLSSYAPRPDDARFTTERAPPFERERETTGVTPGPSVRTMIQSEPILLSRPRRVAPASRRPALLVAGVVVAVVAMASLLGLRQAPSVQASTNAAAVPSASPIAVAPPSPAPEAVAPAAPVLLAAVAPSASASSAPIVKRLPGPMPKLTATPTSSQRGGRSSMPLPTQPNF